MSGQVFPQPRKPLLFIRKVWLKGK